MDKSACFRLGQLGRAKGLQGELRLLIEADDPSCYEGLDALFIEEKGALVPYLIERLQLADRGAATVKFAEVDNQDQASALTGSVVHLPLAALPPLGEGQFYYHEIIGFSVVDSVRGTIGPVISVVEGPAQDLLVVDHKGFEVLIPIVEPLVGAVDRGKKELAVDLPDGLLELYMGVSETPDDADSDAN